MSRFWTIETAQAGIKAAYFSRLLFVPGDSSEVWLRFAEIKRAVSEGESPIGDRTLSRALKALVDDGQLKKRVEGRAARYALVTTRPDRVKAFARSEAAAVEAAGAIGGRGDHLEGWAVFGLPDFVPRGYGGRLRRACKAHRAELHSVLDDISEEALEAVLSPAKRKVSRKVFDRGTSAARRLAEFQLLGASGLAVSSRFWGTVEKLVPGTLRSFRRSLGPRGASEVSFPEAITALVSRMSGRRAEELRPEVDRQFQKFERQIERILRDFRPLWEALTPKQQERANRRLQAATAMTASLTSVVHV